MQVIRQLAPCLYYLMFHPPQRLSGAFFWGRQHKKLCAGNGQWKNGLGGPNDKAEEGIEYGSI